MIYLDNAATSFPKAPGVAQAVYESLERPFGNPGRSGNPASLASARVLFETRRALAKLLGLPGPERLVFTANATEGLNLGLRGMVDFLGSRGARACRVAVSSLEHHAVMRPLRSLERRGRVALHVARFGEDGVPCEGELDRLFAFGPDFVAMTAASNVTGALLPVREIGLLCGERGIRFGVDASQAAGHEDLSPLAEVADFIAFPGHKGLLGPTGTGALWLSAGFTPEPLIEGGTGSESASEQQPEFLPDRYEAGTRNVAGIAGLGAAVRYLSGVGIAEAAARARARTERLALALAGLPGLRVYGHGMPGYRGTAIVSVSLAKRASGPADLADLALALDRAGIATRMGLHCAAAAHRSLGTLETGGTLRLSPGPFTGEGEIDEAVGAISTYMKECK